MIKSLFNTNTKGATQLKALLILILTFYLLSCNKNEYDMLNPSSTFIEMEGEGGQKEISFTTEDWRIARIINQNGNVNIFGDKYSIDGNLTQENQLLELNELGRIDAFWGDKGFSIARNTLTSLHISVNENSTDEDFNFVVVIASKSGDKLKEIVVNQKKSQGYTFKKIEYALSEEDGDSIFVRQGASYSFNVASSQEISFSPISGVNIVNSSFFESNDKDAFKWTEADSLVVEIPSGVLDGDLYFNGEVSIYTNATTTKESQYNDVKKTVTIPAGKSKFSIEVEHREVKTSYILHLENNRTGQEKIIEGKWIKIAPTGEYTISWDK